MNQLFKRKNIEDIIRESASGDVLKRNLGVRDLTSLGIAAIIGAGIFSTIGNAAIYGGPAVTLLFVFTAVACGFSALSYAQFASTMPVSGSAYTYTYATFGEIIAWIIGWVLIMEYAVGNIAVAISWSDYFTAMAGGLGWHIPDYLSVDYLSASRGYREAVEMMNNGVEFDSLTFFLREAYIAWTNAPIFSGVRIIADVPAFLIVVLITSLVYRGIYESKVAGNIMVLLKLGILLLVIAVGAFYVNPENWDPFAPNGLGGVMKGVGGVFFAYIGFDAISTTAEECKNPRRDLPRGMIYALLITTAIYILIALVLTGMVHYSKLGVGDPLAFAFKEVNMDKLSGIIALGAVIAMASVLLVFQVGQPRIWMNMSRDGLLPPIFSSVHKKYRTPWFSTIVAGVLVSIPCLFMNLTEVTDLTSLGTLFVFILVTAGVLVMDSNKKMKGSFKIPFLSSRIFLPIVWLIVLFVSIVYFENETKEWISFTIISGNENFYNSIPVILFWVISAIITIFAVKNNFSLIPVLGLLTNLYLISQLDASNWIRFAIWLILGLLIYFSYSYWKSKLRTCQ